MLPRFLLLMAGVFACSTAVIMIKLCDLAVENPVLLAGLRCLVAATALGPLFLRDLRKHRGSYTPRDLRQTLLPGVLLGLHFMSWIVGARMTPAANSTLIVNMAPLVMPFLLYAVLRERLTRGELAGTALALAGVAMLTAFDFRTDRTYFTGDMICFVSMNFFCLYLVLGRKNRGFASVWLYLVPLYLVAGLMCFAASLFFGSPIRPYPTREVLLILGLGIVPTVIGHSILNYSMKHLRGQVVGIGNLGQVVFASVMAFFILSERPAATFYVAAALLVCGILVAFRSAARKATSAAAPDDAAAVVPAAAPREG
jgi:drug/metabolite transporter (DMT)-like permease